MSAPLQLAKMAIAQLSADERRALFSDAPAGDELLTATEACQLLKISRATLWRHFPPALRIGALPRWSKQALMTPEATQ